jgi:hypothetical protein
MVLMCPAKHFVLTDARYELTKDRKLEAKTRNDCPLSWVQRGGDQHFRAPEALQGLLRLSAVRMTQQPAPFVFGAVTAL